MKFVCVHVSLHISIIPTPANCGVANEDNIFNSDKYFHNNYSVIQ